MRDTGTFADGDVCAPEVVFVHRHGQGTSGHGGPDRFPWAGIGQFS